MTLADLQTVLKDIAIKHRLTPNEMDDLHISIQISPAAGPNNIRYNLNLSDKCVNRLEIWVEEHRNE